MKNKKGFTLVELLAVLALLAFVAIIAVPLMDTILKNSKDKTKDAQIKEIIESTKKMVMKYSSDIAFDEDNEYLLPLSELKKTEFLNDEKFYNADTEEELNGCIYIKYDETKEKYKYAYIYDCQTKEETIASSCFIFSNETITGYNASKAGCANPSIIKFPTTIGGQKVRYIKKPSSATYDYFAYANKVEFKEALYLEEIGFESFKKISGSTKFIDKVDFTNNSLLETIGEGAFTGTSYFNISELILPDNINYIGHFAFKSNRLKTLTLPSKTERIQEQAFYDNQLERIVIPSYVKTLGKLSFGKNKLISATINSKKDASEFTMYVDPFGENPEFTDSKIIWKQ